MAQKSYVGVAPLTMVNTGAGGFVYVYEDQPVPEGVSAEDVERLVEKGYIAEAKAESGDSKPATVKDILSGVGDDPAKAQAALDEEKARGKDARSSLVEKLEAIANPSS